MAAHPRRSTLTFRDVRGFTARLSFYTYQEYGPTLFTEVAALVVAIQDITYAALVSAGGPATIPVAAGDYGYANNYISVQDKARLTWECANGTILQTDVPAPRADTGGPGGVDIFLPDKETVNPAQTEMAILIAAASSSHLCTAGGQLVTRFVAGRLVRSGRPQRIGSKQLNPSLSGPGW
jgi:hypothetical protein